MSWLTESIRMNDHRKNYLIGALASMVVTPFVGCALVSHLNAYTIRKGIKVGAALGASVGFLFGYPVTGMVFGMIGGAIGSYGKHTSGSDVSRNHHVR